MAELEPHRLTSEPVFAPPECHVAAIRWQCSAVIRRQSVNPRGMSLLLLRTIPNAMDSYSKNYSLYTFYFPPSLFTTFELLTRLEGDYSEGPREQQQRFLPVFVGTCSHSTQASIPTNQRTSFLGTAAG